eukprot:symbB.v1.2.028477.t1/scaffold3023.1/size65105/2
MRSPWLSPLVFLAGLLPLQRAWVGSRPFPPFRERSRLRSRAIPASEAVMEEVIRIIKQECPSFSGEVSRTLALKTLQSQADSLDTLEAMMELEDHFKVELEDEWMEEVHTVQDLADLIWRTPRGLKLRTVDDETYIAMIRKSHAENRWGELYDGWEKDIPPQYEHRGPSLAEEANSQSDSSDSEPEVPQVDLPKTSKEQPVEAPKMAPPKGLSATEPKISNLDTLTVPQLRQLLRDLGLDDSGPKAQLVRRLTGGSGPLVGWLRKMARRRRPVPYGRLAIDVILPQADVDEDVATFYVFRDDIVMFPMSYSIPQDRILSRVPEKTAFAMNDSMKSFQFKNYKFGPHEEEEYHQHIQTHRFGDTRRKGGFDCLRHYELMANGCIPIFHDLEHLPKSILRTLPKDLLQEAKALFTSWSDA